jgi:hypothetical protein
MDGWTKVKEWVNENAPMLAVVYNNKYVGMGYDRFASLPPKQQKQVLLGTAGGMVGIVVIYLFFSYLSLWSTSGKASSAESMITVLQNYQKQRRDKGSQIQNLEQNGRLAGPGQLKQQLTDDGKNAGISPRLIQVEEKPDSDGGEDAKASHDVKMKRATVTLQRVNLSQLQTFLKNVEFGPFNLSVSSLKITNDSKIRGYMNVDMGVVAYLFQAEEGG